MEDHQKHIEDYLFGRLSNQDRLAFEQAMESDSQLAADVESLRVSKELSKDFLELELRGILNKEGEAPEVETLEVEAKSSKLWMILGGLLGLIALAYMVQKVLSANEERPTYASLYTEPSWPISRSGNGNVLQEGLATALNSDFRTGVDQIYQSNIESNQKYYWLAELFANQEMGDSSLHYTTLIDNPNYNQDRITYLKVLAHNHLGNHEQVQLLIESLPESTDQWYIDKYEHF